MATYISMLRGINVSGQKPMKMDALKALYETLGLQQVQTWIQSGNVVFRSDREPGPLAADIAAAIEQKFGFSVPVFVLAMPQLQRIVAHNPFADDSTKDENFLHITFLAAPPAHIDEIAIEAKLSPGEAIACTPEAVYLYCPNGYGRTKLTNTFIESRLQVAATTRNWKTVNTLLRMAEEVTATDKDK
ncbi:MAG TPA: DUF1697 domain-containing protein [Saprospiraceae bacterium]|nr:DUF1697 domain-containing protein [Saprospiraceae bacterium]HMP22846.1 DUF1697 domain-containing protein [Saprospiraceae bacterium]